MPQRPNLFEEFPPVSKAEWLEKIRQDLKGKAPESLHWHLGRLEVSPFHHLEDRKDHSTGLTKDAGWLIGEAIPAHDLRAANKVAHEAVAAGVESLQFFIDEPLGDHRLEGLLDGIDLASTGIQFYEANKNANPTGILHHLHHIARKRQRTGTSVHGAINWTAHAPLVHDELKQLLRFAMTHFPQFRVLPVNVNSDADPAEELRSLLVQLDHWLNTMTEAGFSSLDVLNHTQVYLSVNSDYFASLCKVRAARMLFHHLAGIWKAPAAKPFFDVAFVLYENSESPYNNLIQATTRAISATAGGADRLTVMPADVQNPTTETGSPTFRRLARNLHHLLRSESYLDAVADPAAGSYFLEDLTEKLAAAAWRRFSEEQ